MSSLASKAPGVKRRKDGYRMAPKIPAGVQLTDSSKKTWIIHTSIGKGGFGEIYTASSAEEPSQKNYVVKVEPSENGPLFCEKTVYIRIGKKEYIREYQKARGLKSIGMPTFYGSGIHIMDGKKYRFLVMERYGKDLWSLFLNYNTFPPPTVYKIAIQVLDVLEYIHSKGYVHADIKGANLLLGRNKGTDNQVYLVDFGLAARYANEYKKDPKRAHNGTIEYVSRDGHDGVVTRRGDIEILAYNLLQWMSSALPWEDLSDAVDVQTKKNKYLADYKILLKACFKNDGIPAPLGKYFENVVHMEPLAQPNYSKLRKIMREGVETSGSTSAKLEFSPEREKTNSKSKSKSPNKPSSVPQQKIRAAHDAVKRRRCLRTPKPTSDETINLSESSSNEDDLVQTTPERKAVKRSWKDCPSVVSCAELLLKDDRLLRRTRRNK